MLCYSASLPPCWPHSATTTSKCPKVYEIASELKLEIAIKMAEIKDGEKWILRQIPEVITLSNHEF